MGEKRYIISDASKLLGVESHVLRYWEEELNVDIPRNEMGHRYYTESHINLLKNVRNLKKQGYGLRTIKMMMTDPDEPRNNAMPLTARKVGAVAEQVDEPRIDMAKSKMEQFQEIMNRAVANAMLNNSDVLGRDISLRVGEKVMKDISYVARVQEEKAEERYRKLDDLMRTKQQISKKEKRKNKKKKGK